MTCNSRFEELRSFVRKADRKMRAEKQEKTQFSIFLSPFVRHQLMSPGRTIEIEPSIAGILYRSERKSVSTPELWRYYLIMQQSQILDEVGAKAWPRQRITWQFALWTFIGLLSASQY